MQLSRVGLHQQLQRGAAVSVLQTRKGWGADTPATAADVATVCEGLDASQWDLPIVLQIEAELDASRGGKRPEAWEVGNLCRLARKAGVPVPLGVEGLPAPTARGWVRAVIAHVRGGGVEAVEAACRVEAAAPFIPAPGLRSAALAPVAPQARPVTIAPPAAAVSDADLVDAFRVRFGADFPANRTPQAAAAVLRWEADNGRAFPVEAYSRSVDHSVPSPAEHREARPPTETGGEEHSEVLAALVRIEGTLAEITKRLAPAGELTDFNSSPLTPESLCQPAPA